MAKLASQAKTQIEIRELAASLVRHLDERDYAGEIEALFRFVRDQVRYLKDIRGVETVQTPIKTLEFRHGDCDDKVTLLAALLESIGHEARFVAMGQEPGVFSHVFLETLLGRRWVALDPTEPVEAGWRPPDIRASMIHMIK